MDEQRPSKTQMKREMHEIQSIGEQLIAMKPETLANFSLSERLISAIQEAKRLKSREALRRQKQYIGKLMKGEDIEQVKEMLDNLEIEKQSLSQDFKHLEQLRSRLLVGGNEAINAVIEEMPHIDRQKLRQLTKRAKSEVKENRPPQAQRELFKFLRTNKEIDKEFP